MRRKIYSILESNPKAEKVNDFYDMFMIITILASLIPLAFKETNAVFRWIDYITVAIFIIDYFLRWITADLKLKKSAVSFLIYPFTPMAIVDLLSILPSVSIVNNSLRLFRVLRLLKALRVFKFLRYSKSFDIITNVFKQQKKVLAAVATLAVAYVFMSALVIYNVEPESFDTFFDAIYWATISLTTVGYGDIYPITTIGKLVAMVSSIFGIAIIALPSGVITAGYMDEIRRQNKENS
ncbi:MAG: ion transporter [Clostridia bacterium]|nr:ion transporter [Clostridia bacterium]